MVFTFCCCVNMCTFEFFPGSRRCKKYGPGVGEGGWGGGGAEGEWEGEPYSTQALYTPLTPPTPLITQQNQLTLLALVSSLQLLGNGIHRL